MAEPIMEDTINKIASGSVKYFFCSMIRIV
jgi:hypothetical protein